MEIWKDVKNYEGIYQVSNLGRIKSLGNDLSKREKILKATKLKSGYLKVSLNDNKKRVDMYIHQLVAVAFLSHEPDGTQKTVVNHKDFNRQNNVLSNLETTSNRKNTNQKHLKENKTSKYTGVSFCKQSGLWRAYIYAGRINHFLGSFTNEYNAHIAYENKLNEILNCN